MNGHTVVNGTRSDIDVSFSDLFDHVDIAGMMAVRSERERSAITANAVFTGLSADGRSASGAPYNVDVTQDLIELNWAWRFDEPYEVYLGARYQSLTTELTVTQPDGTRPERSKVKDLLDPVVGARVALQLGDAWRLIGSTDVGGFGVGSDFTWSALALVDWSFSGSFGLVFGYRALGTQYSQGSDGDRFEFNIVVSGPLLGLRYDFNP